MANVEVRTLRVSAEMDASKYTAGAQEKTNADDRMRQSGKGLGDSFTENEQKISNAGNVLSKLSRQYVDGYANAQRFNQAINQLTRGVETGKIEMTQASAILDGVYRRYGMMADAAKLAERGQTELAKAIQQANTRFQEQAKVAANQNRPGSNFAATNVAYQAQDVIVQAAGGASIGTIALQQGPQLAMALGDQGAAGAARTLAAGLATLVNPVNLVAIGLTAAAAAGVQYFSSILNRGEESTAVLEKQKETIEQVAKKWGDALPSLKAYSDQQDKLAEAAQRTDATKAFSADQWKEIRKSAGDLSIELSDLVSKLQGFGADTTQVVQLQRDFATLTEKIASGKATSDDAKRVQADLMTLYRTTGIPTLKDLAEAYDGVATAAQKANDAAAKAASEQYFLDFRKSLPQLGTLNAPISADGRIITDPIEQQNQRAIDAANRNPTVFSNGRYTGVPVPQARPNIELEGLPGASKGERSAADAYRDLIKTANDRIEQMQLEAKVAGETGIAAAKMRMELDLLQQAQEKGRSVTAEQRAEIEKLAAAYANAATEAAKVRLNADLRFERDQILRSPEDQQIASRQRGLGLPVDLNSQEAQIMRDNMRIEELRSGVKGFFTDFRDGLLQGDSFGQALGNSIINALMNATTKISDRFIDQLVNSLLGSTSSGSLLSKIGIGSIPANDNFAANTTLSKLLGANDNLGKAPVVPVTSAPLGDIASFIRQRAPLYGVDPNTALKVAQSEGGLNSWNLQSGYLKNGIREQSFGPFQLYKGGGLGNAFMRETGLDPALAANGPAATDWSLRYASKNGWSSWYGAAKAGVGNWDGIGGQGTNAATEAVNKLGTSAGLATKGVDSLGGGLGNLTPAVGSAAQGLNQFGSGVGTFGQKLANAFPAAPSSGGGLFGKLFSGLFGGGGLNAFGTSVLGSSAQFAGAWAGGGIGLYASGTDYAPGGMAVVGEGGRELVNLPRGSQVIPNHRTEAMLSGVRGGSPTTVIFKPNIINNNGSNVRTERRDTNDGPQFDIIIDEAVANNMSTPGSRSRRAVKSQFALSESLARR